MGRAGLWPEVHSPVSHVATLVCPLIFIPVLGEGILRCPSKRRVQYALFVALRALAEETGPDYSAVQRNLALEIVRVTEAAALASGRWLGRGDKEAADQVRAVRSHFTS